MYAMTFDVPEYVVTPAAGGRLARVAPLDGLGGGGQVQQNPTLSPEPRK